MAFDIDPEGGVVVTPAIGFVIKGFNGSEKVFVNVCFSSWVNPPSFDTARGGVRIPMSIGPVIGGLDKIGAACKVIDIVVSEETVRKAMTETDFKQYLMEIVIAGIEMKWDVKLEKLRGLKMGYKGIAVQQQRIKVDRTKLIQEVEYIEKPKEPPRFTFDFINKGTGTRFSAFDLPEYMSTESMMRRKLQIEMGTACIYEKFDSSYFTCMEIVIPNILDIESTRMQVSNKRLVVTTSGLTGSTFNIWFPVRLDASSVSAVYSAEQSNITVQMNIC